MKKIKFLIFKFLFWFCIDEVKKAIAEIQAENNVTIEQLEKDINKYKRDWVPRWKVNHRCECSKECRLITLAGRKYAEGHAPKNYRELGRIKRLQSLKEDTNEDTSKKYFS